MSDVPLTGVVALVTGASSGIGAATARRLANEGAAVALVARRRDRLEQVAAEIVGVGRAALVVEADITDPESAEQSVMRTLDRFSRLDILVNSAGIMLLGTALHTRRGEWDRMVELNIEALLHVTHAAVPYLIDAASTSDRRVADIVNLSSAAARTPKAGSSVYTMTKLGLNGFTESLRQELVVERVRVSLVEPDTVATELIDHLDDVTRDDARLQADSIEALRADDVADAIAYIVTREERVAINELVLRAGRQSW
jgi:NADP-dependent 3-hydroxy acid dehydrogenase YdfG